MTEVIARKKLIEVALPLEAINTASARSAREKSIRHGHPSTFAQVTMHHRLRRDRLC